MKLVLFVMKFFVVVWYITHIVTKLNELLVYVWIQVTRRNKAALDKNELLSFDVMWPVLIKGRENLSRWMHSGYYAVSQNDKNTKFQRGLINMLRKVIIRSVAFYQFPFEKYPGRKYWVLPRPRSTKKIPHMHRDMI